LTAPVPFVVLWTRSPPAAAGCRAQPMSPHAASMSTTWMVVHFDPPRCERQRAPRASDMLLSLVEPQQEQAIARMQIAIKVDSRPPRAMGARLSSRLRWWRRLEEG
jgi:hypothetical protein